MRGQSLPEIGSDSATEGCDERCPSVLLDLGVGEKAEEIRMTF